MSDIQECINLLKVVNDDRLCLLSKIKLLEEQLFFSNIENKTEKKKVEHEHNLKKKFKHELEEVLKREDKLEHTFKEVLEDKYDLERDLKNALKREGKLENKLKHLEHDMVLKPENVLEKVSKRKFDIESKNEPDLRTLLDESLSNKQYPKKNRSIILYETPPYIHSIRPCKNRCRGELCGFFHKDDKINIIHDSGSNKFCNFFAKGICKFENCKNTHAKTSNGYAIYANPRNEEDIIFPNECLNRI